MKVYMKKYLSAYSGKDVEEGVIYSSHNYGNVCIARTYKKPKLTDNNTNFAKNAKQCKLLWDNVSESFKVEMKIYAQLLSIDFPEKIKASSYPLFVGLVYKLASSLDVMACELNVEDLYENGAGSIAEAAESGYLIYVQNVEALTKPIL